MKAGMVCQVLLLVLVFSIASIFALNTDIVRTSELTAGISSDVKHISEKYIKGEYSTNSEYYEALDSAMSAYESETRSVKFYVLGADKDLKIADVFVEYTYKQFNGSERTKSIRETVIKDEGATEFCYRSISKEFFKTADGSMFVPESEGGLLEDSIWKSSLYEGILSLHLNYERDEAGNWPTVQYSK